MRTLAARLIGIKAVGRRRADKEASAAPAAPVARSLEMPASAIPGVALVISMFAVFIIALGGVQLRLFLTDRREARLARPKA